MKGQRTNPAQTPWWLDVGPEHCEFCQHGYHYEAVYHCVHCDRPICPVCVIEVRESHKVVCTECAAEEDW